MNDKPAPTQVNARDERERLIVVLKNRYAARHPWAHAFRNWPLVGRFYRQARARFIEEQLGS